MGATPLKRTRGGKRHKRGPRAAAVAVIACGHGAALEDHEAPAADGGSRPSSEAPAVEPIPLVPSTSAFASALLDASLTRLRSRVTDIVESQAVRDEFIDAHEELRQGSLVWLHGTIGVVLRFDVFDGDTCGFILYVDVDTEHVDSHVLQSSLLADDLRNRRNGFVMS